jgi:large subunit ribosomal protein L28
MHSAMDADGNLPIRPRRRNRSRWRVIVAAVCKICGKHPGFGMNVSHSHRRTKRRWDPNIQRVRALVNGTPVRLHVCTSCIRAGKVTKPPRRSSVTSPS